MNTVKEAIAQNNKIIAEFMGITIITDGISFFDTDYKEMKRYDEDWNWLMEVVDRCSQVSEDLNVTSLFSADLWMFYTKDIEAVYNACLAFIKWYNEQKSGVKD